MLNNEVAKFRTKIWIEINNDARGTYNTDRQIKDKTTGIDTSTFFNKTDLTGLKSDGDTLEAIPVDLNKLSNVVKNVVK